MNKLNFLSRGAVVTLALLFSCFSAVAAEETPKPRIPAQIQECEMGEGRYICLTWRWNGNAYEKTGPDGITETITIQFDKTHNSQSGIPVTFVRDVKSGAAEGLGVIYKAELRDGKIENGKVEWTYMNISKTGTWSGTYSY